jgi:hypothetical protein
MEITIKLISCDYKLKLCKVIKDFTGLGLRESKDIVDNLFINFTEKINIKDIYYSDFKEELLGCGQFEINGGLSYERECKILALGIGDREDYINYIVEKFSVIGLKEKEALLLTILNKLEKSDLLEIIS